MSQLFPFVGGKTHLAHFICERLPSHYCFVEPYAGSLAVLLAKSPSPVEVANDLDLEIMDFFLLLREVGNFAPLLERLVQLCRDTPMHRGLYDKWRRSPPPEDRLDRIARWYFLKVCSINGKSGWVHSTCENKADFWQLHVNRLSMAAQRLRRVTFECRDGLEVIKTYDRLDTLFYCDPPYLGVKDVRDYYPNTPAWTDADHEKLAAVLNAIQGKAIVSYYDHSALKELYPWPKWIWERIPQNKWCSTTGAGEEKQEGEELLLYNFEPLPLFRGG